MIYERGRQDADLRGIEYDPHRRAQPRPRPRRHPRRRLPRVLYLRAAVCTAHKDHTYAQNVRRLRAAGRIRVRRQFRRAPRPRQRARRFKRARRCGRGPAAPLRTATAYSSAATA